jgi:hypothetical protein
MCHSKIGLKSFQKSKTALESSRKSKIAQKSSRKSKTAIKKFPKIKKLPQKVPKIQLAVFSTENRHASEIASMALDVLAGIYQQKSAY